MKYTKKQFFADVKAEADAIKQNATKEEIAKLNIKTFYELTKTTCVYGQLTGNCRNERALTLIRKSCKRFLHANGYISQYRNGFDNIQSTINGEIVSRKSLKKLVYYSAIEGYIVLPNAKNANLIAYIKGEKDKLVL